MYVSVQKIFGKSKVYGYSKDVVTTTLNTSTTILYGWQYSSEKFERENYSYKIVVKESYRDGGKVKQKQVVMGTFHWFDFIDHPIYSSEYFDDKLIETFPDKPDEAEKIYDEIDKKIADIQAVESKKWTASEEYKVHNKHLNLIQKYKSKKVAFDELYGEDIFEQIYDIHLKVMNQSLYEELPRIRAEKKKAEEEKREYERRSREEQHKQWEKYFKGFGDGSYQTGSCSNYTDKEKEYLKKFYKALAAKFHPDVLEGDNGPMQLVNKLKEQWGI